MEEIILPDSELNRLERRFGPVVRDMGSWISDGVFGYCSVPVSTIERVAQGSADPSLLVAVARLKASGERTKLFIDLVQTSGTPLINAIAAAHRAGLPDSLPARSATAAGPVVDWQAA